MDEPLPAPQPSEGALAFSVPSVVDAYHHRPSYPPEVAPFLASLANPTLPHVLDLGCGTGELARGLAPLVERVTAVDISPLMLNRARAMPDGDRANIEWRLGPGEAFPDGSYGLAVAGDSLHWMDWDILLPRLARHVVPPRFAILSVAHVDLPWADPLLELIRRYSTARNWAPIGPEQVEARGLYRSERERAFRARTRQSVADYTASFHARASFVVEQMGASGPAFDDALATLVAPYVIGGAVDLTVEARVVWGEPLAGPA